MSDQRRLQTKAAISAVQNRRTRLPSIDFTVYTNDDGQSFSTQERVVKDVQACASQKPTDEQFYSDASRTKPNIAFLKNHFYREGRLTDEQALFILTEATKILREEPNLLEVDAPITVCGDIHGQYFDLMKLFEVGGNPADTRYLFLGDYVDRGKQSLETILLLLCYKVKYPENFFLLRGNHECANVTRVYGFYDECKRRCNIKIWKTFVDVFNCLPIAAVVASKIFCVHGGLSPSLSSMDDIRRISRPTDVPDYGLLNDLLWSDPSDTALDWEDNERGVSYCFGKSVIGAFLARYDFDLICRAHMVVEDGYEFWNERTLVTIFSAPNYCGEFDNFGSVMSVSEDLLCAFELLKPLDTAQLKRELAKTRRRLSSSSSNASTPS